MKGKEEKSKGNFLDFIADASKSPALRKDFIAAAYEAGATAEDLQSFFTGAKYYGVSLDDCIKMLVVVRQGPLPCHFTALKY